MNTFAMGLQAQLDNGTLTGVAARRVKRILALPDSDPRKARILGRMEAHARAHLGFNARESVDWTAGTIDWQTLLKFLATILPLIMALFGL